MVVGEHEYLLAHGALGVRECLRALERVLLFGQRIHVYRAEIGAVLR